jgi:hypothetical protein
LILYKYVGFEDALKIIENSCVSFTKANQFNDPFEMQALSNYSYIIDDSNLSVTQLETAPSKLQTGVNMSYGVLSLTRAPLNNLMWSHYGDEHRGVVIGFDVNEAGFCDKDKNVIPANFGDIIYTKTFPEHLRNESNVQRFNELRSKACYSQDTFEFFKYAYLFKGIDWAYEEEVRVVKNVGFHLYNREDDSKNYYSNSNGQWQHMKISEHKDLNLFSFPKSAIKEIYLGSKVYKIKKIESLLAMLSKDIKVKGCALNSKSYDIVAHNYFGESKT